MEWDSGETVASLPTPWFVWEKLGVAGMARRFDTNNFFLVNVGLPVAKKESKVDCWRYEANEAPIPLSPPSSFVQ